MNGRVRKVAVIGAGPAGITAAYELAKRGIAVDVFEAGPDVGGLAKTIELWGQRVDIGPHRFFSKDARVNRLWLEVVGRDYQMVNRLTRIFYNNKFFYYPLKPFNALSNLGPFAALRCVLSYAKQRYGARTNDGSFEDWVVNAFGRRLFEIFFKTYSEKLWGITCKELDADFAAQRIKKLSLYEAVKNAFQPSKGGEHKTLVDRFAYPKLGSGVVYERMADYVRKAGSRVLARTPVERVLSDGGAVTGVQLQSGESLAYDHVISTMPLTLMVNRLPGVPEEIKQHAAALKFRNTIIVFLRVDAAGLFPDNWLYIHSPELLTGRITNFRNWSPELYGHDRHSILALEYWCNEDDAFWTKDNADLIALASSEIRKTGLIGKANVSDGHVYRINRCYPVYSKDYRLHLKPVEDYLSTVPNLTAIGRYGAFKYNNQDHSILMGLLAAANIAEGQGNNLWAINTDYEDYQESATISEEGLVVSTV